MAKIICLLSFLLFVFGIGTYAVDVIGQSDELRLVTHLLAGYDLNRRTARPTRNSSEAVVVKYGLRLIQIELEEKKQQLRTSCFVRMRWKDEYLGWNLNQFGGQTHVVLPWKAVWIPDIDLANTADTEVVVRPMDVIATKSGYVYWSPHMIYKSACLIDVTNFPYDKHTCHLWFQSSAYLSTQLDLQFVEKAPLDLSTYLASFKESQEWEILENLTARVDQPKDINVILKYSRRPSLRFSLTLQRRIGYTGYLLMLPGCLMAFIMPIVFCLPPERPDRHTLAMSLFASFLVLLLILVEVAPPSANSVPTLGKYYAFNILMVMLSVFLSALVINLSRMGERRKSVPWIVKVIIIDIISRIVFMHSRVGAIFNTFPIKRPKTVRSKRANTSSDNIELGVNATSNMWQPEAEVKPSQNAGTSAVNNNPEDPDGELYRVSRVQWRNIALVCDRFICITYIIIIITIAVYFFPRPS